MQKRDNVFSKQIDFFSFFYLFLIKNERTNENMKCLNNKTIKTILPLLHHQSGEWPMNSQNYPHQNSNF